MKEFTGYPWGTYHDDVPLFLTSSQPESLQGVTTNNRQQYNQDFGTFCRGTFLGTGFATTVGLVCFGWVFLLASCGGSSAGQDFSNTDLPK